MAIEWIYLREEEANTGDMKPTEVKLSKEELDPNKNSSDVLNNKARSALSAAKTHGKDAVTATRNAAMAKSAAMKAAQREKKAEKERTAQQAQDAKNAANADVSQASTYDQAKEDQQYMNDSASPIDNLKLKNKNAPIKKNFSKDFTTNTIINELDIDEDGEMGFMSNSSDEEETDNALDEVMNLLMAKR